MDDQRTDRDRNHIRRPIDERQEALRRVDGSFPHPTSRDCLIRQQTCICSRWKLRRFSAMVPTSIHRDYDERSRPNGSLAIQIRDRCCGHNCGADRGRRVPAYKAKAVPSAADVRNESVAPRDIRRWASESHLRVVLFFALHRILPRTRRILREAISMAGETLQAGDWVRTSSGLTGQVVLIVRLTAFVYVQQREGACTTPSLVSELSKIDPPNPDMP